MRTENKPKHSIERHGREAKPCKVETFIILILTNGQIFDPLAPSNTLTVDGNTITTKADRLTIFDKSSGTWARKVILNQQSQPVSTTKTISTNNTFLTGLYAYYKLDEASGSGAIDSAYARNLVQTTGEGIVGSAAGVRSEERRVGKE